MKLSDLLRISETFPRINYVKHWFIRSTTPRGNIALRAMEVERIKGATYTNMWLLALVFEYLVLDALPEAYLWWFHRLEELHGPQMGAPKRVQREEVPKNKFPKRPERLICFSDSVDTGVCKMNTRCSPVPFFVSAPLLLRSVFDPIRAGVQRRAK